MIFRKALFSTFKGNVVITQDGEKLPYTEIQTYLDEFVNYIPQRSLIFSLSENTIGSLLGYLAFVDLKAVPLMLDSNMDIDLLSSLVTTYCPDYLWVPKNKYNSNFQGQVIYELYGHILIQLKHTKSYKLHPDLALLLTTSGSTGSPKLVKLTYNNMYSNAKSISEYLNITEKERPITSLPMHYSFGLSIINSHLINGSTILLTDNSLMEKEFWSFLKEGRATSVSGIPYSFEILKKLRFMRMDLPYLKTITQAGGKLNDELNKEFSEYAVATGKRFFVMYGQTEATARMSYLPPEFSLKKLGSMGIAIPGGNFSLIHEEGKTIEESEVVGELVYEGPNVSMGYAECGDDLARGDENKGVLITGDLAKKDKDGFYYIVGRKKRFIKLYGNRINLDETERLLKSIIHDCACAGQDDKMKIFINDQSMIDGVRKFISDKTGINSTAFEVLHIDKIPKNSSGKTIYSKLPQ